MALAVRHGDLDRSKVYKSVLDIVDSDMTDEQIKHFTVLKESIYNGYEIKFYNSVIKKYNLDIDKIKSLAPFRRYPYIYKEGSNDRKE